MRDSLPFVGPQPYMAALKTPVTPKREGARQAERKATGRRRDVGNERLLRHRALPLPVFGRPFGTYIPVSLLSRGFALLHHLPVILTPLRGFTQKNLYARSSAILFPKIKAIIRFAPFKNRRKHQKQEKTMRVDKDKNQMFSFVLGGFIVFFISPRSRYPREG